MFSTKTQWRILHCSIAVCLLTVGYVFGNATLTNASSAVIPPGLFESCEYCGKYRQYVFPQIGKVRVHSLSDVELLICRNHSITDDEWNTVCKMQNLAILDLAYSSVTLEQFRRLTEFDSLRVLDLEGMELSEEMQEVLFSLRDIESINLKGTNLTHNAVMKMTENFALWHLVVSEGEANAVGKDLTRPGHMFFKIRTNQSKLYKCVAE